MEAATAGVDPSAFLGLHTQTRFIQPIYATWQAEHQAHEIAVINAQITTHRLASQLFFRFSPIISMIMTPEFKARLGVTSLADAALFANQGQHSRERHPKEAFEILAALPKAEDQLTYIGRSLQHNGRFDLVFNHKVGFHLFMPIKFVSSSASRSGRDECWIETAFVIDDDRLKKKMRKRNLTPA